MFKKFQFDSFDLISSFLHYLHVFSFPMNTFTTFISFANILFHVSYFVFSLVSLKSSRFGPAFVIRIINYTWLLEYQLNELL